MSTASLSFTLLFLAYSIYAFLMAGWLAAWVGRYIGCFAPSYQHSANDKNSENIKNYNLEKIPFDFQKL